MDIRIIVFSVLISIFLAIYLYYFLGLLMLIKIFPKRKELLEKSQYIPIFDYSWRSDKPAVNNPMLYYLDLIYIIPFILAFATIPIFFSGAIGIRLYIIIFILFYSLLAAIKIFTSKIEDLDKFYMRGFQRLGAGGGINEPAIFIRTRDKIIEKMFRYSSILMWCVLGFWILFAVIALILNKVIR